MIDPIVKELPEFMVRVKLPCSGEMPPFDSDEYYSLHNEIRDAIFAVKPDGFEVSWPKLGHNWPRDSEGFVYVPLYCIDPNVHIANLQMSVKGLRSQLKEIQDLVRSGSDGK